MQVLGLTGIDGLSDGCELRNPTKSVSLLGSHMCSQGTVNEHTYTLDVQAFAWNFRRLPEMCMHGRKCMSHAHYTLVIYLFDTRLWQVAQEAQ